MSKSGELYTIYIRWILLLYTHFNHDKIDEANRLNLHRCSLSSNNLNVTMVVVKYGNHDGICIAIKNHFLPPNVVTQENAHVVFGKKTGYKTIYKLVLRNTNAHLNVCVFTDAVGPPPRILQPASPSCPVSEGFRDQRCSAITLQPPHRPEAAGD